MGDHLNAPVSVDRTRDRLQRQFGIDKKIGSVIHMQRVKLGMSQSELGKGVSARIDGGVSQFASWSMKTALKLQEFSPVGRKALQALIEVLPTR